MRVFVSVLVVFGLCFAVDAFQVERNKLSSFDLPKLPASIPQNDRLSKVRAATVLARNLGHKYGPSLIGQASFYPNGTLGILRVQGDMALWSKDREEIDKRVGADVVAIQGAIMKNGGLKSMEDYGRVLYEGQWKNSNPLGTTGGIMTNYTQDLLFSMERLSLNPYPLRRVKSTDKLPFQVPSGITERLTGVSLKDLQSSGNLFIVDHIEQKRYEKTTVAPQRYGAACTAYFYIHPKTKDFLPLAIKTNVGADLIYTPMDSPKDWLLAKMMFNVNDFFHAQMLHLTISHDVSEGVHLAALKKLAPNHPVMLILERLMIQGYSSRTVGEQLCFNPGGHWDQLFLVNNVGCRQFVTEKWPVEGGYQFGYLETDLRNRGLIDNKGQSPFKSFPFFKDASIIRKAQFDFFSEFVNSYYPSEDVIAGDYELQSWFVEVTNGAKVFDFPQCGTSGRPCSRAVLTEVLTHFGFIVSAVHHALNGGDPIGSKATLPFHLNAMFAPVPTTKNVTDLLPFLPPAANAVHYIGFLATFNRPFYPSSNRTLKDAFNDSSLMSNLNKQTNTAATKFMASMEKLSSEIKSRKFDSNGLSLGMPFIYRTLDPAYIPFFSAV